MATATFGPRCPTPSRPPRTSCAARAGGLVCPGALRSLPQGFDLRQNRRSLSGWESAGLRRTDGKPMPRSGEATLFLPAGARGPAFLVTNNYPVIKTYNSSDAYALGVALLGDRIFGGPPIRGAWPKDEPALDMSQRQELQKRLQRLGHDVGE